MKKLIKPCPFCKQEIDINDRDTLYPTGTVWRYEKELDIVTYHSFKDSIAGDNMCWQIVCKCGAEMRGDSRGEVISKWNTR